jgi:hypothetical protein
VSAAARDVSLARRRCVRVFTPAAPRCERTERALIPGLVGGSSARANAAFVNTGGEAAAGHTRVTRFRSDGAPLTPVILGFRAWRQLDGVRWGRGGWVEVRRRRLGLALAYGIANTAWLLGPGTVDGAFVESGEIT